MSRRLEIWGVDGLAEVEPGDDIAALIAATEPDLRSQDVVVVTSKIVSKAEGRLVPGSRDDHLADQTVRTVARRGPTQIVETHHGLVLAAAGIDTSNVPAGMVALLPIDPDASAARIREGLQRICRVDVAVVVSDTMGRPWRDGLVDTAIGAAGLDVMWDLRGQHDAAGHQLEATVVAVADELAAAGDLVKGKLAATPVAVIRGFPVTRREPDLGARPLIRPAADDMFRLGTREAQQQVVADSAPIPATAIDHRDELTDRDSVLRAVDLVTTHTPTGAAVPDVALTVSKDGASVSATGDPLAVGVVLGRLMVALGAEGLRCAAPEVPTDRDVTAVLRVWPVRSGAG